MAGVQERLCPQLDKNVSGNRSLLALKLLKTVLMDFRSDMEPSLRYDIVLRLKFVQELLEV